MFVLIYSVLHADACVVFVQTGETCLHVASAFGHLDVVKFLVQKGGKELSNIKDKQRQTARDFAESAWNMDVVDFLSAK